MMPDPAQGACEERITPQRVSYQPAANGPLTPAWIVAGCVVLFGLIAFVHLLLLYRT